MTSMFMFTYVEINRGQEKCSTKFIGFFEREAAKIILIFLKVGDGREAKYRSLGILIIGILVSKIFRNFGHWRNFVTILPHSGPTATWSWPMR